MKSKQKLYYAVAGLVIGNMLLASLAFGIYLVTNYQSTKNEIPFDEAIQRIKAGEIKQINIRENKALLKTSGETNYLTDVSEEQEIQIRNIAIDRKLTVNVDVGSKKSFERLFQILFILFIISPPIIFILLLIIIKKMNSKDSMK